MPTTDLERLVLRIEASTAKFEANMKRARQTANKELSEIEKRAKAAAKKVSDELTKADKARASASAAALAGAQANPFTLGRIGGAVAVGAAGIAGLSELAQAADSVTRLESQLRAAGFEGDRFNVALESIRKTAQEARQPIDAIGQLYTRLAIGTAQVNATQEQLNLVVNTFSKAIAVSGASASEARSSAIQFAQSLAAGALRGDELNSVLENAPLIAQAIAKEFGVATGQLKQLGEQGKLVSDRVLKAIINNAAEIDEKFKKTSATIGQAATTMGNSFVTLVGKLDDLSGASNAAVGALGSLSTFMDNLGKELEEIGNSPLDAQLEILSASKQISVLSVELGELRETAKLINENPLRFVDGRLAQELERVELQIQRTAAEIVRLQAITSTTPTGQVLRVEPPNSLLRQYDVKMPFSGPVPGSRPSPPPPDTSNIRSAPPLPKAPSGKSEAERTAEAYAELIKRQNERTAALQAEVALVGQSEEVQRRARLELELMQDAERTGIPLTDERKAQLMAIVEAQSAATAATERATQALDAQKQRVQEFGSIAQQSFESLIISGESLEDTMRSALQSLAQYFSQLAFFGNQSQIGLFGGGGSPFGLLGGLFAGGFASGGTIPAGQFALVGERGPEMIYSGSRSRGVAPLAMGGGSDGIVINLDARGADASAVPRIEAAVAKLRSDIPRIIDARSPVAVARAQRRQI